MTKDVLISIKGLQFEGPMEDKSEQIELIVAGQYRYKDGIHYLSYDETVEGLGEATHTRVKVGQDRVELTKRGGIAVAMLFIEDEKNLSTYRTPFGSLMIGIDTTRISVDEQEDSLKVKVYYRLDMNYDFVAECTITIEAYSKERAGALFSS